MQSDLQKLQGRKRVWVFFVHILVGDHGADERLLYLHFLDQIGRCQDRYEIFGDCAAAVYLYDLSPPESSPQADSTKKQVARQGCCRSRTSMHTKAISTCRFSVVSEDAGPTQGPACGEPSLRRISRAMPIYNERRTLATIVKRVLATPFPLDLELVAVDDCSQDGSWEVLQQLAAEDPRIRPIRHERNQGKGTAIRTAIQAMTGNVAVIQDADMEYDPHRACRCCSSQFWTTRPTRSSDRDSRPRPGGSCASGIASATRH